MLFNSDDELIQEDGSEDKFSLMSLKDKISDISKTCFESGLSIEESMNLLDPSEYQGTLFKEALKMEMEYLIFGYGFN